MALTDESGVVMPVSPMGGSGFGNGFGGDGSWLILFLIIAMMGFGGFGGAGFGGGGYDFPWLLNANTNTDNLVTSGFAQQATASQLSGIQSAVTSGFGDTALGIAGINQNICQTGNGIASAVNNGFSQAEIAANARQIADMQQAFNTQTAITGAITDLASQQANCCCENRLATCQTQNIIQNEGNQTRFADANNTRDLLQNQTANTQAILDKLCQLELSAKDDKINDLERQLTMQNLAASQAAQTAALIADNTAQTQYVVNRVAPYPIPSYNVPNPYGCNGYNFGFNG